MGQTAERRPDGTERRSQKAGQVASAVQCRATDGDPALFDAIVERPAFGRPTTTLVPSEYVRGPGPCPIPRGPQDAEAPPSSVDHAERIVMALVESGHGVSSDNLHSRFADEPSASGAAYGALFARLAREGRIIERGWVTRRPEARGRRVVLWGAP